MRANNNIKNNRQSDKILNNNIAKILGNGNQDKPVLQCKYCGYAATQPRRLKIHNEKHHPVEEARASLLTYSCVMCDDQFRDKETLKTHLQVIHLTPVTPVTSTPPMTSSTSSSLQCCICTLKFDTRIILVLHFRKAHLMSPEEAEDIVTELVPGGKETDQVVLDKVSKNPESKITSKEIKQETTVSNSDFICWICHEKFSDVVMFSSHLSEDHQDDDEVRVSTTEVPSSIPTTPKSEPVPEPRKDNSRKPKMPRMQCLVCKEIFLGTRALAQHAEAVHNYVHCRQCRKPFKNLQGLREHAVKRCEGTAKSYRLGTPVHQPSRKPRKLIASSASKEITESLEAT